MSTNSAPPPGDRSPPERAWRAWSNQLKQTRRLVSLRDRANRLALRKRTQTGAQSDAERVRRLQRYILRLSDRLATSEADDVKLALDASQAVSAQVRSLAWLLLRGLGPALLGSLVLGVLGLVLVCSVPQLRHRCFPPDLGRTAKWTASSHFAGAAQKGVGTRPTSAKKGLPDAALFFHTVDEQDPHIDLEFARPVQVRKVIIENRSDCCQERALPLNVEIPGSPDPKILCQRRSPFQVWTCSVRDITTNRIRVRRPGRTMLHLRSIEVYE